MLKHYLFSSREFSPVRYFLLNSFCYLAAGEGVALAVLHKSAALWREHPRPLPGQRLRPAGAAEAVPHAHAEGQGALHPDEDVSRRRERGAQAGGQPIQDRAGQTHEDGKLHRNL